MQALSLFRRSCVLSLLSVLLGTALFLFPGAVLRLSTALNRTLAVLDERLIRHRFVIGLVAFGAGYAFFRLALLVPVIP